MRKAASLLLVCLLPATAAAQDVGVPVPTDGRVPGGIRFKTVEPKAERDDWRPDGEWRRRRTLVIAVPETDTRRDERSPPPAEVEKQVAPPPGPEPLDPSGPGLRLRARTAATANPAWQVGEPLPDDLPHVTLSAARYGLPALPPGQIYARVGRDVLQIEAASRRVVARVSAAP